MEKQYNKDNFFIEISLQEAKEKARKEEEFYLLYPDNTDALYEGDVDLNEHYEGGGGFGIE